ncbi:MAG: hypothetical protein IJV98_07955 [Clostridia bacterium]|nr:hypothetical protein [Clostridia bacterium]
MAELRKNIRCPYCGKYTFKIENDMEICPVCGHVNYVAPVAQQSDTTDAHPAHTYERKLFGGYGADE